MDTSLRNDQDTSHGPAFKDPSHLSSAEPERNLRPDQVGRKRDRLPRWGSLSRVISSAQYVVNQRAIGETTCPFQKPGLWPFARLFYDTAATLRAQQTGPLDSSRSPPGTGFLDLSNKLLGIPTGGGRARAIVNEPVPHPTFCEDVLRVCRIRLNLLAQVIDVQPHVRDLILVLVSPHLGQQRAVRYSPPGILNQVTEQPELGGSLTCPTNC